MHFYYQYPYLHPNPYHNYHVSSNVDPITNQEDNALVMLAKQTTLTKTKKAVLRKGLTFVPKPKNYIYKPYTKTSETSCIE